MVTWLCRCRGYSLEVLDQDAARDSAHDGIHSRAMGIWKAHVRSNHADYRRDCITCVMSRGTGKRHARVRYPDQFCLTIDLAGPIKPGLDSTSKGTIGKGLRYMVVAKFTLPKEFVKSYSGKEPPRTGEWEQWEGRE